ncbi:unnamed protein product [Cuscuta europaea]|uniref:Sister chromatid cohesion 1 protein 4 n=1 Tax=Cuscuta europaea TaxID=41803 RepID=A0A9P1E4C8_CUSEU|nr:unnamed protein product [Cuscuta europaea]
MFYSQFILAKKGPLGTIWIAAHLERKLRKNQIADTDIGVSVDTILSPDAPIALRLSSHLLLGVVRIYSRKVNYLFDDCSEALLKVKQAFRSTAVDLPPEKSKAPYHSITLPETFELDDFELPDIDTIHGNYVDHHVSSREQITLQDPMKGVAYSTSKFGPDERFGDGDTLGLDFDEDLFLDNVAATGDAGVSVDAQVSVEPMTPLKQDELHDAMAANSESMVDGAEGDTDFVEYAHAPCTPGLAEEPDLSNIQETSACDDHLENEYQNPTKSIIGGVHNIPLGDDVCDGSSLTRHMPMPNNAHPDAVLDTQFEENGCHSGAVQFPSSEVAFECFPLDNHTLVSETPAHVNPISAPLQELTDETVKPSDDPKEAEITQNQIFYNDKVDISSHSGLDKDYPSHDGINLEEDACNIPGLKSIEFSVSADAMQVCQTSPHGKEPEIHQEQINSINLMNSAQFHTLKPCNAQNQADTSKPCSEHLDLEIQSDCNGLYSPKTSELHISSTLEPSIVQGETCPLTENFEQISCENHEEVPKLCIVSQASREKSNVLVEDVAVISAHCPEQNPCNSALQEVPKLCGVSQASSEKSNVLVEDVTVISAHCPEQNPCNSALSDLPTPEKFVSIPGGVVDLQRGVLVEDSQGLSGRINDSCPSDSKFISGRKRSYTESTLTEQSLNSFESSRMTHSRTTELIPNDEDLLSSILAGKRSSTLKFKPTPHDKSSIKRRRVARSSILKRKVLMDDTMVLHGDTIREQLTYTEDIRRVRKRAPCTCSEISLIEKQILEDQIFSETLLTGVSMELGCLHKETFDLMGIKVLRENYPKQTSVRDENSKTLGIQISDKFDGPHTTRENESGGADELSVRRDDGDVDAILATNKQGEHDNQSLDDNNATQMLMDSGEHDDQSLDDNNATQMLMDTTVDVDEAHALQLEFSRNAVEAEIDGAKDTALAADGFLCHTNGASGDLAEANTSQCEVSGNAVEVGIEQVNNSLCDELAGFGSLYPTDGVLAKANASQLEHSGNAVDMELDQTNTSLDDAENNALAGVGCLYPMHDVLANANASQLVLSGIGIEPGFDQTNASLDNDNAASAGVGFQYPSDAALGISSRLVVTDCDASNGLDSSMQLNGSCMSNEHEMGNEDFVPTNMSCDKLINDNNLLEGNTVDIAEIENYPRAKEDVSSGVAQVDAEVEANKDIRVEYDPQFLTNNVICGENLTVDDTTGAGEIPSEQETYLQSLFDGEVSVIELNVPDVSNYSGAMNDTGFLNDDHDDDEEAGEAGDGTFDAEKACLTENSGWSSRTRAVAKYLQTVFSKETEHGRNTISLDSLLAGKTRKEACRMFFEALVLKTKDYVHVEQAIPCDDITIQPRMQLMRSEF